MHRSSKMWMIPHAASAKLDAVWQKSGGLRALVEASRAKNRNED
jgi:hypothetical protein